ncbi:YjbH domain-containing protein [Zunongwangia pacifica]|uniref:YjbH domain-containing protein n=1 Tax=Zunongwangia pacifica TaxID=2911062 RepID=A0A9X2CNB5_9FLAO|nr:YjbH domain-containing protein [Zunongwangia pacifica]MCL6216767.1 YjbH domain-containing protein [Zunongwangia pacifica]
MLQENLLFKSFIKTTGFLFLLLLSIYGYSQNNFLGKPGYMTIPTADWKDGHELGFSYGFIPAAYSDDTFSPGSEENDVDVYSVRVKLTQFMEVNFGIFYRSEISDKIGVGDRQLDFRFRILKEKQYWPAIVLGWTPPGSRSPVISHDYLVATKNFQSSLGKFQVSLGYGSPYFLYRNLEDDNNFWESLQFRKKQSFGNNTYLTGVYGGVSYEPLHFLGASLEYNTSTFNAGVYAKLWNEHIMLQAYTFEGKELAFNINLQFSLHFLPRSLRRYEKK